MSDKNTTRWLVACVHFGQLLRFGSATLLLLGWIWTLNGAFQTSSSTAADFLATVLGRCAASLLAATFTAAAGSWIRSESLKRLERDHQDAPVTDPRPPVVYFRPFSEDLRQRKAVRRVSFFLPLAPEQLGFTAEQAIARSLSEIGPLVAIGQPGERVPPVTGGFSRLYVSNEEWQRTAAAMLHRGTLLVFVAGTSDGLFWEIRRAFSMVSKSRILILICRTDGLEVFRRRMNQEVGVKLPLWNSTSSWRLQTAYTQSSPLASTELQGFTDQSYGG
jgi:hypothetical protein